MEQNIKSETLKFVDGSIYVHAKKNVLYMKVRGCYTDAMALHMLKYIDMVAQTMPSPVIRVWDSLELLPKDFLLTTDCINAIIGWSRKFKTRYPYSKVYFVTSSPYTYGISRMYQIQAEDTDMDVTVINGLNELPESIKINIEGS